MQRLRAAVAWACTAPRCRDLPLGLFGASTGAAAALCVAVLEQEAVSAVVSRGGRPDLAGERILKLVRTPVLLVVGGADHEVLAPNRAAKALLGTWATMKIVPGAGHLFEEPGTLERAAALAAGFLVLELSAGPGKAASARCNRTGVLPAVVSSKPAPAGSMSTGPSW